MRESSKNETLWAFSLRTYSKRGVPEACLALQDECGADVNVVLYCCWSGLHAGALDEAAFSKILALASAWAGSVVRPLRDVRRWMKGSGCALDGIDAEACMALRERVKSVELQAEKLQQQAMEQMPLPDGGGAGLDAAAVNLDRYFRALGAPRGSRLKERVAVVLRAASASADPAEIDRALGRVDLG